MCSVLGFYSKQQSDDDLLQLEQIWTESKIRGLHSFGYTIKKQGKLLTRKEHNLFQIMEAMKDDWPFAEMIGHCRYSTSGDWQNHDNNQPIFLGDSSLVFNGVVSMKTKEQYQLEYGREYATENDGEIVLRKFLDGENVEQFISKAKFSFAGAILTERDFKIIRNKNRPLWFAKRNKSLFLSSTKDILIRSGLENTVEVPANLFISAKDANDSIS